MEVGEKIVMQSLDNMLYEARQAFVDAGHPMGRPVREEILASWRRCARSGVAPDGTDLSYSGSIDTDGFVLATAGPVLEDLRRFLDISNVGAVLADERGQVLWSSKPVVQLGGRFGSVRPEPGLMCDELSLGTNAIGLTQVNQRSSVVYGHEHYTERFTSVACAAAPVCHPMSGQLVCIVNMSSLVRDSNALLLGLAERAASQIDDLLVDAVAGPERLVVEQFRRLRQGLKGPAAVLTPTNLLTNAAAADLLGDVDHNQLWASASAAACSSGNPGFVLPGEPGTYIRCDPLKGGSLPVAYLLTIDREDRDGLDDSNGRIEPNGALARGWARLTEREREIAAVVANGFTNKQAASLVMLSPHTVDYHIRQVFRKLGVNSRVELTRIVLERSGRFGSEWGVGA